MTIRNIGNALRMDIDYHPRRHDLKQHNCEVFKSRNMHSYDMSIWELKKKQAGNGQTLSVMEEDSIGSQEE